MQRIAFTDLEDLEISSEDDIFDYDILHLDVIYVLVGCVIAYVMAQK